MSEKKRKTWYVGDRAELLAQIFLEDLNPISVSRDVAWPMPRGSEQINLFDYTVTFAAPNGTLRLIAVEVKATERPIKDNHAFKADVIRKLASINVPVLILVVNVKNNAIYYAWARTAAEVLPEDADTTTIHVPVKRADEHKEELLQEILGTANAVESL
jgi:hypothetical protein